MVVRIDANYVEQSKDGSKFKWTQRSLRFSVCRLISKAGLCEKRDDELTFARLVAEVVNIFVRHESRTNRVAGWAIQGPPNRAFHSIFSIASSNDVESATERIGLGFPIRFEPIPTVCDTCRRSVNVHRESRRSHAVDNFVRNAVTPEPGWTRSPGLIHCPQSHCSNVCSRFDSNEDSERGDFGR